MGETACKFLFIIFFIEFQIKYYILKKDRHDLEMIDPRIFVENKPSKDEINLTHFQKIIKFLKNCDVKFEKSTDRI